MERKIIVSKVASEKLENLLSYLVQHWSIRAKNDFLKKLDKAVFLLKKQPEIFPVSEKEIWLRKCVITKQTTLYFEFDDNEVRILTFYDNRQNPEKLKKDL